MTASGTIRVGIGGWDFEPWRGTFFPPGLPKTRQLEHVGAQLTATEINATYYKLQSPALFAKWAKAVPDGFKLAVKASRFCTNRRVLGEGGESIAKFCAQGLTELGDKLGPILWQFMGTKKFDAEDVAAFFAKLPREHNGLPLRHAIEVGHESFACAEFVDLARQASVAIVWCEQASRVSIADRTTDFAYLRCKNLEGSQATGYAPEGIERIAGICRAWANGAAPAGLQYAGSPADSRGKVGDVFAFMINGAKVRAPAAALALAEKLKGSE